MSGFTLVELMIVISIIGILASIAVPNFISSRATANEIAVIGSLRNISIAQATFRDALSADTNRDGISEFGFLSELMGTKPVRGSTLALDPTPLNPSFSEVDSGGFSERNGYLFRLYLPSSTGQGLAETTSNLPLVDAVQAPHFFTVLAWPVLYGRTGQRSFFLNQTGEILATIDAAYSGRAGTPLPNAALVGVGGGIISTNSLALDGALGADGNRWQVIQ